MEFEGNYREHHPLVNFSYNNSYHGSIGIAPYEAMYYRLCKSLICWEKYEDFIIMGADFIDKTTKNIHIVQD